MKTTVVLSEAELVKALHNHLQKSWPQLHGKFAAGVEFIATERGCKAEIHLFDTKAGAERFNESGDESGDEKPQSTIPQDTQTLEGITK